MTEKTPMTVEVPLKGRTIHMEPPSPEQILAWKRIIKRFEGMDARAMTGLEALDNIDRCVNIVTSLFALPEDVAWLEDGLLDKSITFNDILVHFQDTVVAFSNLAAEQGNRADRRAVKTAKAATPAKKVTRKRAPAARTTTPRKGTR